MFVHTSCCLNTKNQFVSVCPLYVDVEHLHISDTLFAHLDSFSKKRRHLSSFNHNIICLVGKKKQQRCRYHFEDGPLLLHTIPQVS